MLDNFQPIPDAEPLPFYLLVLKLVVFGRQVFRCLKKPLEACWGVFHASTNARWTLCEVRAGAAIRKLIPIFVLIGALQRRFSTHHRSILILRPWIQEFISWNWSFNVSLHPQNNLHVMKFAIWTGTQRNITIKFYRWEWKWYTMNFEPFQ